MPEFLHDVLYIFLQKTIDNMRKSRADVSEFLKIYNVRGFCCVNNSNLLALFVDCSVTDDLVILFVQNAYHLVKIKQICGDLEASSPPDGIVHKACYKNDII